MIHTRMVPEIVDIVKIISCEKELSEGLKADNIVFSESPLWLKQAIKKDIISLNTYYDKPTVCVYDSSGSRTYLTEGDYILCKEKRIIGLKAEVYDISGYTPNPSVVSNINIEEMEWIF